MFSRLAAAIESKNHVRYRRCIFCVKSIYEHLRYVYIEGSRTSTAFSSPSIFTEEKWTIVLADRVYCKADANLDV